MVFSHTQNTSRTLFAGANPLYGLVYRNLCNFSGVFVWETAVISLVFWHTVSFHFICGLEGFSFHDSVPNLAILEIILCLI